MKEHIVIKYRHTILFYLLATLVPWVFWFAASYVSHHDVYSESTWLAPLLGLTGLCFPMFLTIILIFLLSHFFPILFSYLINSSYLCAQLNEN